MLPCIDQKQTRPIRARSPMCQYRPVRGPSRWAWIRERAFLFPCWCEADAPLAMEASQPTTPKRQKMAPFRRHGSPGTNFFSPILSDGASLAGMRLKRANVIMPHNQSGFSADLFADVNPLLHRAPCAGMRTRISPSASGTGLTRASLDGRGETFPFTLPFSNALFCRFAKWNGKTVRVIHGTVLAAWAL